MYEDLIFQPFTEDHLDAAAEIFVEAFAAEPWNELWSHESARRRLSDIVQSPGFVGWSAFCKGEFIGFVLGRLEPSREEKHFYLQEMCVSTRFQRRGVGRCMLAHFEEALKEAGCSQIYLLTARESAAERFYAANGFRSAYRAVVMVRRLT